MEHIDAPADGAVQAVGISCRDGGDPGRTWGSPGIAIPHRLALGDIANLNNRQIDNGYVILCVARATSDITLEIGVESHDMLYRNPFLDPLQPHELKADIATPKDA